MKKENTQEVIAKKKKQKKIACYVGIVVLNILLVTPPLLRAFVEDTRGKNVKELVIVNCNKTNESISSSFLNAEPQNILYSIHGNIFIESEVADEVENQTGVATTSENNVDNENSNNESNSNSETTSTQTENTTDASVDNNQTVTSENNSSQDNNVENNSQEGTTSNNDGSSDNSENSDFTNQKPSKNPNYVDDKSFYLLVFDKGTADYDETTNTSSISLPTSSLKGLNEYNTSFKTPELQESYFSGLGFACSITKMNA